MKLGIIAALNTEIKPTLSAFSHTSRRIEHLRFYDAGLFVFVAGGVGAKPAAAASLVMVDHFKPDALVSAGFCGALSDELETGQLIIGGTKKRPADEKLLEMAQAAAPNAKAGRIKTVEKVVVKAEEKKKLGEESGAAVVDMEAEAVALAARSRNVGFLSVKSVIDTPAEPLASTYAGCLVVLRDVLLRPGTVMQMVYDSKRVNIASGRLREFFVALASLMTVTG
jgi:nucleoside phosphorylase